MIRIRIDRPHGNGRQKKAETDVAEKPGNRNRAVPNFEHQIAAAKGQVGNANEKRRVRCEDVRRLGGHGLVRQKGALSSFHIPTETIRHPIWRERYGANERSDEHCELQRRERLALTRHAELAGCKLIIDPFLTYDRYGEYARRVRLQCLYDFLNQMHDDKCQAVISRGLGHGLSNTYVGDWFAAESVLAVLGKGYYQTIFTRHAALVRSKAADFDSEFDELLAMEGEIHGRRIVPEESRLHAMRVIAGEIALLPGRTASL